MILQLTCGILYTRRGVFPFAVGMDLPRSICQVCEKAFKHCGTTRQRSFNTWPDQPRLYTEIGEWFVWMWQMCSTVLIVSLCSITCIQ